MNNLKLTQPEPKILEGTFRAIRLDQEEDKTAILNSLIKGIRSGIRRRIRQAEIKVTKISCQIIDRQAGNRGEILTVLWQAAEIC